MFRALAAPLLVVALGGAEARPSEVETRELPTSAQEELAYAEEVAGDEASVQVETEEPAASPQEWPVELDGLASPDPAPDEAPPPAPVSEAEQAALFDQFYGGLNAYGRWVETPEYGHVFVPDRQLQTANWRPYVYGRWVWTSYGWTWASDEPFGWATYHYGRWAHGPQWGWYWVPGYVWGPAWVVWRAGDSSIGWAPLYPGYVAYAPGYPFYVNHWVFVGGAHFYGYPIHAHCFWDPGVIHHHHRHSHWGRHWHHRGHHRVYAGPRHSDVERWSGGPVETVTIVDAPTPRDSRIVESPAAPRRLAVYRPQPLDHRAVRSRTPRVPGFAAPRRPKYAQVPRVGSGLEPTKLRAPTLPRPPRPPRLDTATSARRHVGGDGAAVRELGSRAVAPRMAPSVNPTGERRRLQVKPPYTPSLTPRAPRVPAVHTPLAKPPRAPAERSTRHVPRAPVAPIDLPRARPAPRAPVAPAAPRASVPRVAPPRFRAPRSEVRSTVRPTPPARSRSVGARVPRTMAPRALQAPRVTTPRAAQVPRVVAPPRSPTPRAAQVPRVVAPPRAPTPRVTTQRPNRAPRAFQPAQRPTPRVAAPPRPRPVPRRVAPAKPEKKSAPRLSAPALRAPRAKSPAH